MINLRYAALALAVTAIESSNRGLVVSTELRDISPFRVTRAEVKHERWAES
jgi:hypothetical protein